MSRYRAKRPFATSKLKAPFLRSIAEIPEKVAAGEFPFTRPFLASGEFSLDFTSPVTFFVGENGTSKSKQLEAVAGLCGFNPQGRSRGNNYRQWRRRRCPWPRARHAPGLAAQGVERLLLPGGELLQFCH
jgi:hypothetical protein